MWNVPRLFNYSFDHFKRQFGAEKIHPAVVLAIAQENGIPSLIRPAVQALAEPTMSLSSWCSNGDVLRYTRVEEVSAIARMKEQLYLSRISILNVPPVIHGSGCDIVSRGKCELVWAQYWNMVVGKKVWRLLDGKLCYQLWVIWSDLLKAQIPGMGETCHQMTLEKVGDYSCWFSDRHIINGAIAYLMVSERVPEWHGSDSGN